MTTEQKIEAIKEAIEKAKNHQSKMDDVAWSVPALSSLKIRHLMNNLGAISTRYLECGVHKGGLFCSTIRNNGLEWAIANDNWASDEDVHNVDQAQPQFMANVRACKSDNTRFAPYKCNTFDLDPALITEPIDLYLFDADHSYQSQRKAMTYFLPAMADEFIVCVDDFDWEDVWRGTSDGIILDSNCEILFSETWQGNDHDNDGAWNGFYVALLKKK